MTRALDFETADGTLNLAPDRAIIAGWTGRSREAVEHHIEELRAIGVSPPSQVPLFYRVAADLLTTDGRIQTVGETSSGEAEPVLIATEEGLWLGLGSDHTDRELEAHSVALSKQLCAKPLAPALWRFDEVAGHLDDIRIRSFVRDDEGQAWQPYQDGTLAMMLPLAELADAAPGGLRPGTAMMCGTFPVLGGGVRPARFFRMEMIDDARSRRMEHSYETVALPVVA